ncbi:hypothetical protein V502_04490, partial [Pseudogymnoascus sp. VKM F-4520 (FW-2644)]
PTSTLINGAQAFNVYFIVRSSAAIGGATAMNGNILAYTSVAVTNAASNKGTVCVLNGAVTLINNALTAQTYTELGPGITIIYTDSTAAVFHDNSLAEQRLGACAVVAFPWVAIGVGLVED